MLLSAASALAIPRYVPLDPEEEEDEAVEEEDAGKEYDDDEDDDDCLLMEGCRTKLCPSVREDRMEHGCSAR